MNYICPVCEYDGLEDQPYDEDGWGSFEICPQCGTEYGYDLVNSSLEDGDQALCNMKFSQETLDVLHAELRQRWIDGGRKWWSACDKPER